MFVSFLKHINAIPWKFTTKHYQTFGSHAAALKENSLDSPESWDALRESHPHFSISETREGWLETAELKVMKDGQDKGLASRAKKIAMLLKRENIIAIFSAGVGGAGLEYQINKAEPNVNMVCSEYTEQGVRLLKNVFREAADIILFDILKGDWDLIRNRYLQNSSSVLLIYRLDAGFDDEKWRNIFEMIHKAGIERILYIPTTCLTIMSLWNRKSRELKWLLSRTPVSFAGYLRTKKTFISFWSGLYETEELMFGGLKGFYLKKYKK